MMKKTLCVLLSLVLVLAAACAAAVAESTLADLVSAARTLLFETSNVTISGQAVFYYEGERFKTADILYMQDGENSHWQLDLLTPRPYRADRETGYTIIANGTEIYTMERYRPGTYTLGYDQECSTLVRRSTRAEALASMAVASAGIIESLLPAGSVTTQPAEGGTDVRISLAAGAAPDLLNSGLNLVTDFALRRFMGVDYDYLQTGSYSRFDNYETVTAAILNTTSSFTLGDTDVAVRVDGQGRFVSATGTVNVLLDSPERKGALLTVTFRLFFSDYGSTVVDAFNPADFHVVPAGSEEGYTPAVSAIDPELSEKLVSRAREILAAAGCDVDLPVETWQSDGLFYVSFREGSGITRVWISMDADGSLVAYADNREEYYLQDVRQSSIADLPEDISVLLLGFVHQILPDLTPAIQSFIPIMEYEYNGTLYQCVAGLDASGEESDITLIVRTGASPEIVSFGYVD